MAIPTLIELWMATWMSFLSCGCSLRVCGCCKCAELRASVRVGGGGGWGSGSYPERAVDNDNPERRVDDDNPVSAVNDSCSVGMRLLMGTPCIKAVDFIAVSKSAPIVRCNFFRERTNDGTASSLGISNHLGPFKLQ